MLEGLAPDVAPRLMIAIGGVALAFVILIVVLVFLKRKNSPLFIKGGRAREHRLVVLDAAAVDAKRRLVLIRRDETEHLIMIGGPTDIVIETCINSRQAEAVVERPQSDARAVSDARPALAVMSKEAPADVRRGEPRVVNPEPRAVDTERAQGDRRAERQMRRQDRTEAETNTAGARGISAASSVLYGEEREPVARELPASRPDVVAAEAQPAARIAEAPLVDQAEELLDQARDRVLPEHSHQAEAEKAAADEAAVKAMTERLEAARAEALRLEAEKAEAAKAEAARAEAERAEAERAEAERAEAQRAEAERVEAERIEAQRAEAARIQAEQEAAERAAAQREEAERLAAQREEAERLYTQQMAARRLEAERLERERAEARRLESARLRAEAEKRAQAEEAERRAQADAERQRAIAENQRVEPVLNTAYAEQLADQSSDSLATDFEKLLEVELQKGGILDDGSAPHVQAEPRDTAVRPGVYPVAREVAPIVTGATPGISVEQDMARRLGEISLNKKTDSA